MATYERRSVFLPPQAVEKTRYTGRDQDGHPRLLPDVDLMDAIAELCRIEERGGGILIVRRTNAQEAISEAARERWSQQRGNAR